MGGGLERRYVGRVYGADCAARSNCIIQYLVSSHSVGGGPMRKRPPTPHAV